MVDGPVVADEEPIVDGFIDDSGNTGEDLQHPVQRNMFLACLTVPVTRAPAFWAKVEVAWRIASCVTSRPVHEIELKGEQLYGGNSVFKDVPLKDRCHIMDTLADAMITERAYVFWEGLPKQMWLDYTARLPIKLPFCETALYGFCSGIYELYDALYGRSRFRVTADENSWMGAGRVLQGKGGETWPNLSGGGVLFQSSAKVRGLQVVDFVVHTLYRANKQAIPQTGETLSNTDKLAASYMQRLASGKILHNMTHSREEIVRVRAASAP
jgi:hypothetical protein